MSPYIEIIKKYETYIQLNISRICRSTVHNISTKYLLFFNIILNFSVPSDESIETLFIVLDIILSDVVLTVCITHMR